tara:strand:+ start:847 stop:1590 length:744 start_codon:yes stop_codon:yes gene_type:complete
MKYLICSGDSFTDKIWRSNCNPEIDTSWPKWPELLGKKLNMKVINLGSSGSGNEYIYSSLQDTIESIEDKSQIGMVIPGWSQCQRRDFQLSGYGDKRKDMWQSDRIDSRGCIIGWVKRSLRIFKNFEYMCQYHNIPYVQIQMIPLFIDYLRKQITEHGYNEYTGEFHEDYNKILKVILEYEKILNTEKFMGWPGIEHLGGYPLNYKMLGKGEDEVLYSFGWTVSEKDTHPNAKGQEKIAEHIYDWLG